MPRNRTRKTNKGSWTTEILQIALNDIKSGRTVRNVSKDYNIPESTLRDKLKNGKICPPQLGRKTTYTKEQEDLLTQNVIEISNIFFGITTTELRRLAFEFSEVNNIATRFEKKNRMAGRDWMVQYMKRNPQITLRKRTMDKKINACEVRQFFTNIKTLFDTFKFERNRMFNVDELCLAKIKFSVNILCCVSATSNFVPPLFIYPQKRQPDNFAEHSSAIFAISDNGYINEDIFLNWLGHFQKYVHASRTNPVLLILDNFTGHISLKIYIFCKENGIVLQAIPSFSSKSLHPLALSLFKTLKSDFTKETDLFLSLHQKISHFQIVEIYNKILIHAEPLNLGDTGFRSAGLCPFNPNKFFAVKPFKEVTEKADDLQAADLVCVVFNETDYEN